MIDPGVQFKAVKADTLLAYGNFCEKRADFFVKAISIHADVKRCVSKPNEAW